MSFLKLIDCPGVDDKQTVFVNIDRCFQIESCYYFHLRSIDDRGWVAPGYGLPAGLFMSSHRNQRIGDVIAGSYVVSTRDYQIRNKRTGIYFLFAILVSMLLLFMNMVIQLIIIIE